MRLAIVVVAASALALTSAAKAADLIISEPPPLDVVEIGSSWEGPYIGAFAGYGRGIAEEPGFDPDDIAGGLAGLVVGYDVAVTDELILGAAADIAWANVGFTCCGDYAHYINWMGSLRARVGFDGGAFMPYLTGGLAVAGATAEGDTTDSATHIGWTAGGGVEIALTDAVSLDLQYRYSDFGSQEYNVYVFDYDVDLNTHQVTAGVNWRF